MLASEESRIRDAVAERIKNLEDLVSSCREAGALPEGSTLSSRIERIDVDAGVAIVEITDDYQGCRITDRLVLRREGDLWRIVIETLA